MGIHDVPDWKLDDDEEEIPDPICCYADDMKQDLITGNWVCLHCHKVINGDDYDAIMATHEPFI